MAPYAAFEHSHAPHFFPSTNFTAPRTRWSFPATPSREASYIRGCLFAEMRNRQSDLPTLHESDLCALPWSMTSNGLQPFVLRVLLRFNLRRKSTHAQKMGLLGAGSTLITRRERSGANYLAESAELVGCFGEGCSYIELWWSSRRI